MSDIFSEVDLSDNAIPIQSVELELNHRACQKNSSASHKQRSSSSSRTNSINTPLHINTSFHEISSPSIPLLDSNSSLPLSLNTPSSSMRHPSSSSLSPSLTITSSRSSSLSPKNFIRSTDSMYLTQYSFDFPLTRQDSIIDSLLSAIYERDTSIYGVSSSQDSDTVTTGDCTDRSMNPRRLSDISMLHDNNTVFSKSNLANKSIEELKQLCNDIQQEINQANAVLIKNLRHRDKNLSKLQRNCDIITAILQAASLKRREDTTMRFSLTPCPGEKAFQQWKDAIAVAIRMPEGLPSSIRQKLWISLATNYIREIHLDWNKTCRFAFNNLSNPDDDQLGIQIVKDLHRTGCSWSSNEHDRATLKRVLLAFARYNKSIGYCQGLNILAGVILDVVNMNEEYALMILIYLIDNILPNFFSNNLRALAIDMAVFREWLKINNGKLHLHLQKLQLSSYDASGTIYEPPLLNVFTIQWFLTLFATCLSRQATLRVWDALMIEGSEILFRTGLVLWSKLSISILKASTADQFYSAMTNLSVELLDEKIIDANNLIQEIYGLGSFPTPILAELRQKFSFNITPFQQLSASTTSLPDSREIKQATVKTNNDELKLKNNKRSKIKINIINDDEVTTDQDIANFMSCFAILPLSSRNNRLECHSNDSIINNNPTALSRLTPGAYSNLPTTYKTNSIEDSLSLDITQLRQQYKKLKERNKQVQIIIQTVSNEQKQRSRAPSIHSSIMNNSDNFHRPTTHSLESSIRKLPSSVCSISSGPLVNHLLIKPTDMKRNQFKQVVSIKSSSSSVPVNDRQPKIIPSESIPQQNTQRSKEQEAEEATELKQELDQLLTSLTLEKPLSSSSLPNISEEQEKSATDDKIQLTNVVKTLYNYDKSHLTSTDKKESSNLIDHVLTSRSVQISKYSSFNPFPSRSFNENVAINGCKLGLYAPNPANR